MITYNCMPQITIYLDRQTEALVDRAVRKAGVSKSRWIAEAIRARAASEWPAAVAAPHGAWGDFPSLEKIRRTAGRDLARERL